MFRPTQWHTIGYILADIALSHVKSVCYIISLISIFLLIYYTELSFIIMANNTYVSEPIPLWYVGVVVSVLYPVALTAIVANVYVLVITIRSRLSRDNTGLVITSMAVNDLLTGIFGFEFSITMWKTDNSWTYCKIQLALTLLLVQVSICHILLMNIERYIYILHPFIYQRFFTRTTTLLCIASLWMSSFSCFILVNVPGHQSISCFYGSSSIALSLVGFSITVILPILSVGVMFFRTYRTVSKQTCMIHQQLASVQPSPNVPLKHPPQKNIIKMIATIMLAFLMTWFPAQLIPIICEALNVGVDVLLNTIIPWSIIMLFINAAINPFLYVVYNPRYKKAMMCKRRKHRTRNGHSHIVSSVMSCLGYWFRKYKSLCVLIARVLIFVDIIFCWL